MLCQPEVCIERAALAGARIFVIRAGVRGRRSTGGVRV
jgi:hypothetical protein